MSAGRIVLLIFGIILVLVSFGLLVSGGVIVAIDSAVRDNQGFYMTGSEPVDSNSPVIITQSALIRFEPGWHIENRNPITIKVEATSDNASKAIFIGIARESDLSNYLKGVAFDEITGLNVRPYRIELQHHSGINNPSPPANQTFWVASAAGTGTQTMQWDVTSGRYSMVLMNADGSSPISAHVSLGAKIPEILHNIGIGLLIGGIVLLAIGGTMIFFAARGW